MSVGRCAQIKCQLMGVRHNINFFRSLGVCICVMAISPRSSPNNDLCVDIILPWSAMTTFTRRKTPYWLIESNKCCREWKSRSIFRRRREIINYGTSGLRKVVWLLRLGNSLFRVHTPFFIAVSERTVEKCMGTGVDNTSAKLPDSFVISREWIIYANVCLMTAVAAAHTRAVNIKFDIFKTFLLRLQHSCCKWAKMQSHIIYTTDEFSQTHNWLFCNTCASECRCIIRVANYCSL